MRMVQLIGEVIQRESPVKTQTEHFDRWIWSFSQMLLSTFFSAWSMQMCSLLEEKKKIWIEQVGKLVCRRVEKLSDRQRYM